MPETSEERRRGERRGKESGEEKRGEENIGGKTTFHIVKRDRVG